jgi:hypothetical protein
VCAGLRWHVGPGTAGWRIRIVQMSRLAYSFAAPVRVEGQVQFAVLRGAVCSGVIRIFLPSRKSLPDYGIKDYFLRIGMIHGVLRAPNISNGPRVLFSRWSIPCPKDRCRVTEPARERTK